MKKTLLVFSVLLILCLLFSACGLFSGSQETADAPAEEPATPVEQTDPVPNETESGEDVIGKDQTDEETDAPQTQDADEGVETTAPESGSSGGGSGSSGAPTPNSGGEQGNELEPDWTNGKANELEPDWK